MFVDFCEVCAHLEKITLLQGGIDSPHRPAVAVQLDSDEVADELVPVGFDEKLIQYFENPENTEQPRIANVGLLSRASDPVVIKGFIQERHVA